MDLKTKCELTLYDFKRDPDEITKIIERNPTKIQRVGDLYKLNGKDMLRMENLWSIEEEFINMDVNDAIEEFIFKIKPYENKIKILTNISLVFLCIVYKYSPYNTELYISKENIKFLSNLNSEFELLIYNYSK